MLTAKATTIALIRTSSSETRKESLWSAWHLLLHVVHVGPFLPMAFSPMEEEPTRMGREARRTLDDQVQRLEAAGVGVEEAHLRVGGAPGEILALAEDLGAEVVVMGSRGRGGIRRAFMGSVFDSIVCHAPCPVLMVRK